MCIRDREEHDSLLHSKVRCEEPAGHLHDRQADRKLQMAEREPDQQIASDSRIADAHVYRYQQQQEGRLRMQKDKEHGQEQEAASACRAQQDTSEVEHPHRTEPHVINLEDESADDLLDALADAAAEVPEAPLDATDEGY